jgi:histidinol-phosphate aminotransferase
MNADEPLADRLQRTIRQDVQSMHAYAIQPSAGSSSSTRWRTRSAAARTAARTGRAAGRVAINRYPVQCIADVVAALAAFVDLPAGCKLMLGNGSDELIDMLLGGLQPCPAPRMLAPLPGFVMYEMSAKLRGLQFVGVPLTADFQLDEAAMLAAIERSTGRR